ncbi:site-specific integrase [Flavobacteriaceae bacterium TK19130]|nr:site-specific integrase [Thermobacterium salinum]
MAKKRYSDPKLHIPKVNGRPSVATGKIWYVSFYWRTDPDGPLDKKFSFYKNINRLETAKERRAAGKALANAYRTALERGWNPQTKTAVLKGKRFDQPMTIQNSFRKAFEIKKKTKKQPTIDSYEFHMNRFLGWCKKNGYLGMEAHKFSIDHFYEYMDYVRFEYTSEKTGKPLSGTSVNNHIRNLSAFFTTLKNERIINVNFLKGIPKVDEDPVNNRAFTVDDIKKIKARLEKEDPYLIYFISFMLYPLLRPREICRLKVKDIDLGSGTLSVETKTESLSTRRIIQKLKPVIDKLQILDQPGDYHLFSNIDRPKPWSDAKLKSRVDHFGERFRKVKNKMGYGREYSLYSFRHTAIMDLYHSFQKKGMGDQEILFKLMPITQHKSVAGLKNYLRQHLRTLPPDHSDIYTIDF